ncbi:Rrf2 family transcriptional regulator [Chelativorans salis]|uniref:Rrf2 family transcriptional regulator n=1 Tax=Chelativorans salis TaxID=2978478 RepID=A0ABT2LJ87_9HYPH|nr:Rrf2 family transcriptional regulator [Chelativorans sp. EGI FJ00035]MCT7373753.1 Rrf2 family transcriptional regulator [Chelativorans sp. EGI FJ00035]
MPRDSRMSRMLHVLIHMDRHVKRATSEDISKMLGTNPVVVRRMMAGLRDKGYVTSEKGHGGGWELTCALEDITLLEVYKAIGEPPLFSIGPHADHPDCLVEQAVDARMEKTLGEAEALLVARFGTITVAELAEDFELRLESRQAQAGADGVCAD